MTNAFSVICLKSSVSIAFDFLNDFTSKQTKKTKYLQVQSFLNLVLVLLRSLSLLEATVQQQAVCIM